MTATGVRWMLAAVVTIALGSAILGIGQGGGGTDEDASATTTTTNGTRTAVTALGAVADRGRQSFEDNGCGGCHRLADAGTNGTIGPDLDEVLSDDTVAAIREDILDPGAEATPGFPSGRMPDGYDRLPAAELDALVRYLQAATSGR
ncbi:cytochrome c [Patulibacter sp.]|uniref:c-type cytochrome n=1 Tax=Patulibacter sp. TaxID=1912859 RepID=UPI0027166A19|nr:cytochrome c [Patulibacter sp.]MDO9410625.1 cytochrome c [Patulibacter sp.]